MVKKKNLSATQEMWVQPLGQEDPLEKGNGNPFQDSCLENPTDRGAWRATVPGVAKSRTRLNNFTLKIYIYCILAFPISPPKGNTTEWAHTHSHTHTHTHTRTHTHSHTFKDPVILYICFGSEFAIAQSRVFIFTEIKHPLTFSGSFTPSESLCSQREHEKKIPPHHL